MFKVYILKITNPNNQYLNRLFLEAKWYYNNIIATENIKDFDTKTKEIIVKCKDGTQRTEHTTHLSSQMRQQIYKRIWDNIKGLSASKKNGRKIGKLKFTSKYNCIPMSNQTIRINKNKIRLQGNKQSFKVRGFEQLPDDYDLRKADLVRKPSGIYIHLTIKVPNVKIEKTKAVGLDLGIKDHLTFHDGTKINFHQDLTRLKQLHKSLSRKVKGSKNWNKAKRLLQLEYERLSNQKEDAANKIINKLKPYTVYYQDEMINGWQAGLFGKAVSKSILGRIKSKLGSSDNLKLDKSKPTTSLCPNCGCLNKHGLDKRVYSCECGYTSDRDTHAANNMIIIGSERANVEKESDLCKIFSEIECKHLSMNQEAAML